TSLISRFTAPPAGAVKLYHTPLLVPAPSQLNEPSAVEFSVLPLVAPDGQLPDAPILSDVADEQTSFIGGGIT
ncbi:MAG: hypothetical protein KDB75_11740, partial [Flavobacteriales bacterium]|nr:hypothetical protein [Flavobacteriales bacterium]